MGRFLSLVGKILLIGILGACLLLVVVLALFQLALTFHLVVFS